MGRKRTAVNRALPSGLRCRDGYYSYTNPIDGRERGLGRDRQRAIRQAILWNAGRGITGRRTSSDGLLSEDEIVASAVSPSNLCGVYFLVLGHKIVYVGKSINVHYRIAEHLTRRVIKFDRYHFVQCDASAVDDLEALYIATYRPAHNRDLRIKLVPRLGTQQALYIG